MAIVTSPDRLTTASLLAISPAVRGLEIRGMAFKLDELEPPTATWVTPDDLLAIFCRNSKVGLQLQANARIWTPGGDFVQYLMGFTPTSDRTINVFGRALYYGYLVSVNCYAVGGTQGNRGQTYVAVNIVRPPLANSLPNWGLGTDYLTGINQIQWPHSRLINSTEGPGVLLSLGVTTPAAGADWTQTVPTGARWRVRFIRAQLSTSAAVGNRTVLTIADDGVNRFSDAADGPVQTAGLIILYDWIPGHATGGPAANTVTLPFPGDMSLGPGQRFGVATSGLQAGDQWSAIRILVEEVIED